MGVTARVLHKRRLEEGGAVREITVPPLRGSFLLCYNLHHVPASPPHGAKHDGAPSWLAGRARPATSIEMGIGNGD